ncbi:unnamed protein product [Lactuca saligna]|uniref:TIR domain-containing protein n=1 Tax=Lactuca saligna TaxID=75948 RepID=A0AA36EPE5_LACSI|nr:unnamed protein product [Lactuca saligna]
MASSSTSSKQKSFKYDVFLSFRGIDTRKNFVDHLYHALQQQGIYTYKDDVRITKRKRISDELIGSIQDSKFYIIVFSKNYASSSWCLDELVKIMECHKTTQHNVYPVFYDVEPTEVRKQSGAVGEAFAKHEKAEAAEKWREAMKEAADLAGLELKNTADGHEAKFIQKIVEDISLELHTINFSYDKKLVGIETRVNDLVSSLDIGINDVRMIGIKGMGGAGKTTLARAVFDKISFRFEGKSFVENVREVTNTPLSGLKSLQEQILSDVLNDKDIRVSGVHEGQNILKKRMRGRKVLIALDDVDDIEQLEALAGEHDWFKSGSRIIITTRDKQVLLAHRVTLIHDVNLLSDKEASCLFSRYAFGREIPVQGYQELSEQVVHYASGLPLTIKVLGSLLFGKDKVEWKDALERLKTIPLAKTLKILELSYTALEDDYKEIFLDVACIMKGGTRKDQVIKVLESCGFCAKIGLRVLQLKSLITVHVYRGYEFVSMHDHLREMGMNIVRRLHPKMPQKHSRLWKNDEIEHILANDLGTEETRCIRLYTEKLDPYILIKGLAKMKALRFLYVDMRDCLWNLELDTFSPSFPDTLEYLSFNQYPFTSLPKTFQASNLVTLEMRRSKIILLWEGGERKVLEKLRFLDLSYSKLKTLDLRLVPNLETLTLTGCSDLVEFPDGIWKLEHLKSLELDGCKLLEKLSEDLHRLRYLEKLNLSSTSIEYLPDSISILKHLKYLQLDRCQLIEKLPEDLGQLKSLEHLSLSSTKIQHLPDSIYMLKHLESLKLDNCTLLEKIPEDVGKLESLEHLTLSYTKIQYLPDSICMLKRLESLKLTNCQLLEKLPEDLGQLESLEQLSLSSTKIKHLPNSICMLKHLKSLELNFILLEELPEDLGQLESLEHLTLSSTKIQHLPDSICMLKHLKSLNLGDCWFLEKLPEDLGQLKCLDKLHISYTKIKHFPDSISMLKHLKVLKLHDWASFEMLPEDLSGLRCLKVLLMLSTKIRHLPDSICMLKHLKLLSLAQCWLLEKLPDDIGRLEFLEKLRLHHTKIKYLPDSISMLKHLKVLKLDECQLLEMLPEDLGGLDCLEVLRLSYTKIRNLPDSICMLKHLEYLDLDHCSVLEKLPEDLSGLVCLQVLRLPYTYIRYLPDSICMLKQLRVLNLRECSLLEKLPEDLGELESLEFLNIVGTSVWFIPQGIHNLIVGLHFCGSRRLLHSFGFDVEDEDINEDKYIYEYEDDYEDQYGYGYEYDDEEEDEML